MLREGPLCQRHLLLFLECCPNQCSGKGRCVNDICCCFLKAVPTSAQGRVAVSTTFASVWPDGQLKIVTWGLVAIVTMATVRQDSVSVTSVGMETTARTKQLATR